MNELNTLVRRSVARDDVRKSDGDCGRQGQLISSLTHSFSRSVLVLPMCALCHENPVSPYLSSATGSQQPRSTGPIGISDLCEGCFRVAYRAIVRPLLADELQRCRLAKLLEDTATACADSDACLARSAKRLSPLRDTDLWACPRCTFAGNRGIDSKCTVCETDAPHVTACNACGLHLTPSTIGKPCDSAAARAPPPVKKTPHAAPCRPPPPASNRPPPSRPVHAVWACSTCTFVNTVEAEACFTCGSTRGWECPRCTAINESVQSPHGERCCSVCGTTSTTMSVAAAQLMGIDPQDVIRERQQQAETRAATQRLEERLSSLGLVRSTQAGDGNCQFRGLAHQLFGMPSLHMFVRQVVVTYMSGRGREAFLPLFADESDFERYLTTMSRDATWGDELTLRAAADALGCHVHVITSDQQNWHLHFEPAGKENTDQTDATYSQSMAPGPAPALDATVMLPVRSVVAAIRSELQRAAEAESADSSTRARAGQELVLQTTRNFSADWPEDTEDGFPHVFLAYHAPVHYDDVAVRGRDGSCRPLGKHTVDMCRTVSAVLERMLRDEREWIDAGDTGQLRQTPERTGAESLHGEDGDAFVHIRSPDANSQMRLHLHMT